MANGWTSARRARQAELIRQWRPWEKATGPRTQEGKATVARNAYRGGSWRLLLDPCRPERLGRYEVHLDRKLERTLAMLFKLKDLRSVQPVI